MKVSLITITYNSSATVEDTIRSVVNQDYPDIEYLIVDGKSKDKTLEIVNRYADKISKVVSEKDEGLYDALNKGIRMAEGDVIGMLHSDDIYAHNEVIRHVVETFQKNPEAEAVYADLVFVNRNDTSKVMRVWESGQYTPGDFLKGWMPPHPTLFVRREVYQKFGGFDTSLRLSADYELMLRLIHKNGIKLAYLNETIVKMRMGGVSNVSFFVKLKANMEDTLAWRKNNLKPGTFTLLRKPLRKLGQYFRRTFSFLV